jgi:hypothetical protein
MLEGKLCERCKGKVQPAKAKHKQTKYCVECARIKKRENTENPWTPEERRAYMRGYMRDYRAQARLGCWVWFLPFLGVDGLWSEMRNLSFEDITKGIVYAEFLVIEATGLALVIVLCIQHLKHALKSEDRATRKEDKDKEA